MKWYVKQLSEMVNVSVRTLHHYDHIGLLTPSFREGNRYRLYSEADLLRLQQILALKFLGFELNQIKAMLDDNDDLLSQLQLQCELLKRKSDALLQASHLLQRVSDDYTRDKSISWENIVKTIEVYQMTQEIEDAWVKEIFNEEELKEYAEFELSLKKGSNATEKEAFQKTWFKIIEDINENIQLDPRSEQGIELGKRTMDCINAMYGKKYAHLRTKKFEQGFGEGKGLGQHGLTAEVIQFMEGAVDAYWRARVRLILDHIHTKPVDDLLAEWHQLMDEMYGNETARKIELLAMAENDSDVSDAEYAWLKKHVVY